MRFVVDVCLMVIYRTNKEECSLYIVIHPTSDSHCIEVNTLLLYIHQCSDNNCSRASFEDRQIHIPLIHMLRILLLLLLYTVNNNVHKMSLSDFLLLLMFFFLW